MEFSFLYDLNIKIKFLFKNIIIITLSCTVVTVIIVYIIYHIKLFENLNILLVRIYLL